MCCKPPGHHALNTGKEEGFVTKPFAITAKYIQKKYNLKKILIIDWDYHHGNSTESFFYNDPSVLFSTHDRYAYPGTGLPIKKVKAKDMVLILMSICLVVLKMTKFYLYSIKF